jgi:cell division protein FtsB
MSKFAIAKEQLRRVIILGVILSISLYILAIGIRNVFRYNEFKHELETRQIEYTNAVSLNQNYKKQLSEMKDNAYWELEARRRLGYIQKNEKVVKIIYEVSEKR